MSNRSVETQRILKFGLKASACKAVPSTLLSTRPRASCIKTQSPVPCTHLISSQTRSLTACSSSCASSKSNSKGAAEGEAASKTSGRRQGKRWWLNQSRHQGSSQRRLSSLGRYICLPSRMHGVWGNSCNFKHPGESKVLRAYQARLALLPRRAVLQARGASAPAPP